MPPDSSRGPLAGGWREIDEFDQLLGQRLALARRAVGIHGVDGEGHVLVHGHPGQQRILLEDDAALGAGLGDPRAVQDDLAGIGCHEAADRAR